MKIADHIALSYFNWVFDEKFKKSDQNFNNNNTVYGFSK